MTCTGAENIFPIAIDGTFDYAQRTVKDLFADLHFRTSVNLSAVNSINLARIWHSQYIIICVVKHSCPTKRGNGICGSHRKFR